jgi:hypothetical protein
MKRSFAILASLIICVSCDAPSETKSSGDGDESVAGTSAPDSRNDAFVAAQEVGVAFMDGDWGVVLENMDSRYYEHLVSFP